MTIKSNDQCDYCEGTGAHPNGRFTEDCPECDGSGRAPVMCTDSTDEFFGPEDFTAEEYKALANGTHYLDVNGYVRPKTATDGGTK